MNKTMIKKHFLVAVILIFPFFNFPAFCADKTNVTLAQLIKEWNAILDSLTENKLDDFNSLLTQYENSNEIYVNVLINKGYGAYTNQIRSSLQKLKEDVKSENNELILNNIKDISKMLFLLSLEENDVMKKSSLANLSILTLSLLLILILSIILFLFITKLEKIKKEAKEFGYYSDFIIEGVQKERKRISRELHDTICQDLRTIRLETELLNIREEDKEGKEKQIFITNMLTKNITELREICNTLSPISTIKEKSSAYQTFLTSIDNFIDAFQKRTGINCNIKIDSDIDSGKLTFYKFENIFGIIHEAFNNIEKHSGASDVSMLIRNDEIAQKKSLLIFIVDNGVGFDKISTVGLHFGMNNMKQRANELSAKFEITSEKDDGTKIRLEVPIE